MAKSRSKAAVLRRLEARLKKKMKKKEKANQKKKMDGQIATLRKRLASM